MTGKPDSPFSNDALKDLAVETIHLSAEDQHALADAILNPPPPSSAMTRAVERHKRLMREVLPVEALDNAELDAIASTDMARCHRHLNHELDDQCPVRHDEP